MRVSDAKTLPERKRQAKLLARMARLPFSVYADGMENTASLVYDVKRAAILYVLDATGRVVLADSPSYANTHARSVLKRLLNPKQ